ncbi:hypothetical protein LINGRAHAP2_LOCUS3403 [Linum grandiflorum]
MCIIRENRASSPSPLVSTSKKRQHQQQQVKKHKVQVIGLTRSRRRCGDQGIKKDNMELKNLKLYLENRTIYEANEKLRERACLLHLENLELQRKLLHLDHKH